MARVHYEDAPNDIWYQPCEPGTTYRWQQSASEVRVIVEISGCGSGADLDVDFATSALCVSSYDRKLLSGCLAHAIVPDACVWDFCARECILSIFMQKANLSLFVQPGEHSRTEWRRLFSSDRYEVRFDDAPKDFSDLPKISQLPFQRDAAVSLQGRLLAHSDDSLRDGSKEADDLRRRTRMERLSVLHGI